MTDRDFWIMVRQALLLVIDAIERKLEMSERTSDLRKRERSSILGAR
jgi:hypothetical protein